VNILFLEKSTEGSTQLTSTLENLGHTVTSESSLETAVKKITSDPYIDMVISSYQTECADCNQLLKHVRENAKFKWLPILMVSESWRDVGVAECLKNGATEIIALPVDPESLRAKLTSAELNGKRKILVVDDDELIRDLLKESLELERHTVETAASGEEALEMLKQSLPHLIISDVKMPGMSGYDLLKKIKTDHANVPVIMITGYTGNLTPEQIIAKGADGFFKKPFRNVEISFTVNKILRQRPKSGSDRRPAVPA